MGRPSALTEAQKQEAAEMLSRGVSWKDVCARFGVSRATLSRQVTKLAHKRTETVKAVADQLVTAELALSNLTVSERAQALQIKSELLEISRHLGAAARYGAGMAHRLNAIASKTLDQVDDAAPMEGLHHLKMVSTMTNLASDAAKIPLNLLAANKGRIERLQDEEERNTGPDGHPKAKTVLPTDVIEASRVYRDLMTGG